MIYQVLCSVRRQNRVRFLPVIILVLIYLVAIDLCHSRKAYCGCYDEASLTYDFPQRDRLSESWERISPKSKWGPHARRYPLVEVPAGCDPVKWQRLRVIAVAKRYIGLPYRHHHVPDWQPGTGTGPGLDCSNFTAWVYNYGLGIKFTANIHKQSEGPLAPGRRLQEGELFRPGDLLFILKRDRSQVSHVVIFIDDSHIIDDTGSGVEVRPFAGWYKTHFSHARRIIE
ncbi:MAG: C40 family peptidase [Desulfobaccales bacterium]